ncbi:MAG: DUF3667 domain-containing protein [Melioribacteraceae bacterium]|nr:DUF3667 domain-containing protein [Melioribacteraceae bacterium]
MSKKLRKSESYLNCGVKIEDYNYCPNCGQLNTHKQIPLRVFLHEMFGDLFTFDSKFFKSIIPLLKKPGHLTNEYNEGRRASYVFPLRLYLFTSLMFFFFYSLSGFVDGKFFDSKNEMIFANTDTLTHLLDMYDDEISDLGKEMLPRELTSKYILTQRETFGSIQDQIYDTLSIMKSSNLPYIKKKHFLSILCDSFIFKKKKDKINNSEILDSLKTLINNTEIGSSLNEKDTLVAGLSNIYKIGLRHSITKYVIMLNDPDRDSLNVTYLWNEEKADSSGFASLIEKQAKKIMTGGKVSQEMFIKDMINQAPKAIFLLLPIFAFLLKLLYVRHKIYYINHLIFTLHIHSIFFIYIIILLFWSAWYIFLIIFILLNVSIFIAMRRVYGQSRIKTFFKMGFILTVYVFCVSFATGIVAFVSLMNL